MWLYEKRLQYPVNVRKPDAKTAKIVISQLGGPNGELGAALRYLNPVSYTHLDVYKRQTS